MSRLADHLETAQAAIVSSWLATVRETSPNAERGFVSRLLREIAAGLRASEVAATSPAAQEHAQVRREAGLTQEAVVREYVALRALVLRDELPEPAELRLFDSWIFLAITETAATFELGAMKDALAQADMARMLARQREAEHRALIAEQLARTSAARLQTIADALPVLISWVGADERYEFVNKTYERWFARERSAVVGRTAVEIIGEAAYAVMKTHIHRALRGEAFSFDQKAVPYPERTRDIRASFVPQRDGKGNVLGFVVLMEDLDETQRVP